MRRELHQALVDQVLRGDDGRRAQAFHNEGLPPSLASLIDKVARRPAQVTAADIAAARASGFSEDELFELIVCAAVGASSRLYDAGLSALAEVS
jgi:alkylhydroperoxidase family enzyme